MGRVRRGRRGRKKRGQMKRIGQKSEDRSTRCDGAGVGGGVGGYRFARRRLKYERALWVHILASHFVFCIAVNHRHTELFEAVFALLRVSITSGEARGRWKRNYTGVRNRKRCTALYGNVLVLP